jgi:hypothetical protein
MENLLKDNFVLSYPVYMNTVCFVRPHTFRSPCRHFTTSCSFVYIDLYSKNVLIGQFPSKSVKVFRKLWWVSISLKSVKNVWQLKLLMQVYTLKELTKENFYHVFDEKLWSCKLAFKGVSEWMSEWLLFSANSAIFQLYHGENKLIFNEMMMMMRSSLF